MRENLLTTGKGAKESFQGNLYEHVKKLLKNYVVPFYADPAVQFTENRQEANRVVGLKSSIAVTPGLLEPPSL